LKRDWELRAFKYLVNIPFRLLDRILKFPEPKYPQTKMLRSTYEMMLVTYRLEVKKGVFDVPDGNFERFLKVSAKLIAQIAERDRYYRKWVGLSYYLAQEELKRLDLSPQEIVARIKEQWHDDLSFLPESHFSCCKQDFTEIVLTQNLCNLARITQNNLLLGSTLWGTAMKVKEKSEKI
jgi:hypothetical protein